MRKFATEMERILTRYRTAIVAAVLVLFGIMLAVLSIGNHLCFRTYGLDLGIYTKVAYDYSRLRVNDCTFFLWEPSNILADHFDLLLVLLSPLVRLFGAGALLVVQILAVLAGALGMYKLSGKWIEGNGKCSGPSRPLPNFIFQLSALLMPLLTFGTWHALGFDYHSNVVGAMLLPWLLLFVGQRRLWPSVIVAVLIAICKESSALWLAFVLVALMIEYWRDRQLRRVLAIGTAVTVAYMAVVTLWVMPSFGGSSRGFWRYEWMGATFGEVAKWLITHPLEAVRDLFVDFIKDSNCGHIKREFYICFLLSGGICCLLRPRYMIMLLPPLALKMLSALPNNFWGVNFHYNVELCMVACVAMVDLVAKGPGIKVKGINILPLIIVLLTAGTLLYSVGHPQSDIRRADVNIIKKEHYRQHDIDVKVARRMIRQIPSDASVCATTMFTPHLATRDSIYIFPMGMAHDVEYYLIRSSCWSYYDGDEELAARLIADTSNYTILDSDGEIFLLKKKKRL